MHKDTVIVAKESHGPKLVEIQYKDDGMSMYIYADGCGGPLYFNVLDEQLLDMLLNTILDFKSQVADNRRRDA